VFENVIVMVNVIVMMNVIVIENVDGIVFEVVITRIHLRGLGPWPRPP